MGSKCREKTPAKVADRSQVNAHMEHIERRQQGLSSKNQYGSLKSTSIKPQLSVLGKRSRSGNREVSRERGNATSKRRCQAPSSPIDKLCKECLDIDWNSAINKWIKFKGVMTWAGKEIGSGIGSRFRNPPRTNCPLCRQLQAPWIGRFLSKQEPGIRWLADDKGDRIHIFRHLRHSPHVNDFPTSRSALRRHKAPYHIAVVPAAGNWRQELQAHIAARGMVTVMHIGDPKPEIFVPRQVSDSFDPSKVQPWLKYCEKHHKATTCRPKMPDVKGMKLINCRTRTIQYCQPEDRYLALSYVWGRPPQQEPPQPPSAEASDKPMPQDEKEMARPVALVLPHISRSRLGSKRQSLLNQSPTAMGRNAAHRNAAARLQKLPLKLPDVVPLTIEDAIIVTLRLGYDRLWVDQYCIDQKNDAEKQQQCARMSDIYAGSEATIFALGRSSQSGLPGVSSRRRKWQPQRTRVGSYEFVCTLPDPHLSIKSSIWSTRAWTYQEGLFSTRRLFFTNHEIYFECSAMNVTETFESNLKILHTQNGRRFRAYHRVGRFVCGNSHEYSHLDVRGSTTNHRKIDNIRRCDYQLRQYTKRVMTRDDDVLNAFTGVACYYSRTTAKIASLAGLSIPFPMARLSTSIEQELLNHLSFALAWTHRVHILAEPRPKKINADFDQKRPKLPWSPSGNPCPQRRSGFPSWSWAGWFGEIVKRTDLPYCWSSGLNNVSVVFRDGSQEDYCDKLKRAGQYHPGLIQRLLTATDLRFDAYVFDPKKLEFWERDPCMPSRWIPSRKMRACLSTGPCTWEGLYEKVMNGYYEVVVIGTYGAPRKDIYKAIQVADKKAHNARVRRIDLFDRLDSDAVVCLIIRTVKGASYRVGLLRIDFDGTVGDAARRSWKKGEKRRFMLK